MTRFTKPMIAALLMGGMTAVAMPAHAAKKEAAPVTGIDQKNLSKNGRAALVVAQKAEAAGDLPGTLAALRAAEQAGGLNDTDKMFIAQMKLGLGNKMKDEALLTEALTSSLDNPLLPAADRSKYTRVVADAAIKRRDYKTAVAMYEKMIVAEPNNPDNLLNLALIYRDLKQTPQAIATLSKAIDARKAAGTKAEESWYQTRLQLAYDAKTPDVGSASEALVTDYPTATNWSNVLNIYRDAVNADDQLNLDTFRLMRAAGALGGERIWQEYASTALEKGLPGEAKKVLDDGIAAKKLTGTKPIEKEIASVAAPKLKADQASLPGLEKDAAKAPNGKTALGTGDAYYGYGNYAKAAEMYRLAVGKSTGVDQATANLRLGAALTMTGDKAGATAAFNAVTGTPRAQLGKYWLVYLGQKA
ncbi:tetratricopeptide repeat protein [Glacieibacterium frigidum]|uniref:Tetratricopeptide repeat protein n=1 Tax=Glacieibacterium frigidum TaxID=2593303 RepID=A0A552U751_9SPHN|nr:tetratricopeptide repeat protein [Glacieibacterium frigidum]TRW14040.1 tetratricopeptide repeat protein [Glacieibacterium frigidum]